MVGPVARGGLVTTTALTALVVCGFVWGGFVTLLVRAIRAERRGDDG